MLTIIFEIIRIRVTNSMLQIIIYLQVDYQYCVWATPAIDLLYVLYLVASAEVRQRFKSELISYYYNELTRTLKNIGHLAKLPTMLDLQIELQRNGFLGNYNREIYSTGFKCRRKFTSKRVFGPFIVKIV